MDDLVRNLPVQVRAPWERMVAAAMAVREALHDGRSVGRSMTVDYDEADRDLWAAVQKEYGTCCCATDPLSCPSVDVHGELYGLITDIEEDV